MNDLNKNLFFDIKNIIEDGKQNLAIAVNATLTSTYWHIGKRINDNILQNKRAEYGKEIVSSLARQLTDEYGKGFTVKYLGKMMRFAEVFPNNQIVASLMRQLSWTHFKEINYYLCPEGITLIAVGFNLRTDSNTTTTPNGVAQ